MTEPQLIDLILEILHDHAKPVDIQDYLSRRKGMDLRTTEFKMNFSGAMKTLKALDLIVESESMIGGDYRLTTSPVGHLFISRHGSYSKFREWEKKEEIRKDREAKRNRWVETLKTILAIVFGVSAAVLGWTNYFDKEDLARQKQIIENQQAVIDSLKSAAAESQMTNSASQPTQPHQLPTHPQSSPASSPSH